MRDAPAIRPSIFKRFTFDTQRPLGNNPTVNRFAPVDRLRNSSAKQNERRGFILKSLTNYGEANRIRVTDQQTNPKVKNEFSVTE